MKGDFNGVVGADADLAVLDVHGAEAVIVDLRVDAALEGHLAGAGDGVVRVAAEVHDAAVKDEVGAVGGVAAAVGVLTIGAIGAGIAKHKAKAKAEPKVEKEQKPKKHFHFRKPWEITEDEPDVIDAEFNDVTEEPEKEEN